VPVVTREAHIQVVDRALALLERFSFHRDRWRTNELARACSLPVPTVHRILCVLERQGYVQRDPDTREYRLGPAAHSLGERSIGVAELCGIARPVAERLAAATGDLSSLAVCDESTTRTLVPIVARGANAILGDPEEGGTVQLHAGAHSKVLLAHLPTGRRDEILAAPLDLIGPGTITDPVALRRDLAGILACGFAISHEEVVSDGWAIAMPVRDRSGRVISALGVSAAASAITRATAADKLTALRRAVALLERQLHSPTPGTHDRPAAA